MYLVVLSICDKVFDIATVGDVKEIIKEAKEDNFGSNEQLVGWQPS